MRNYQLLKSVVLLCVLVLVFSCNSKEDISLDQSITQETLEVKSLSSMISSEQAVEVASAFFKIQSGLSGLRSGEGTKSKATVDAINDNAWYLDNNANTTNGNYKNNRQNLYVFP